MAELIGDICFIHRVDQVDQKITLVAYHSSETGQDSTNPVMLNQVAGIIGWDLAQKAIQDEQTLFLSNGSIANDQGNDLFLSIKDQLDVC
jgi:hypothetical protein